MDRKRMRQFALLFAFIFVLIILVIVIGKFIQKYTPAKDRIDLMEYYGLEEEMNAAVVLDYEIVKQQAVVKDNVLYLDYEIVRDLFNSRFYWDNNENLLLYTTAADIISAEANSKDYYVAKEKFSENYVIVYADEEKAYIAIDYIKKYTDFEYEFYKEPNRVVIKTEWPNEECVTVKKDTQIRIKGGIKSPILVDVVKGDVLTVLDNGEKWDKVSTKNGIIGYIQKRKLGKRETVSYDHLYAEEKFSHIKKEGKINMAWHQVTTKDANSTVSDVISNTKGLNVISPTWFYLNDNEGNLMNLSDADYVEYCHEKGIEVWALVSNLENENVDSTEVLTHTSKRTNVVNQLIAAAIQYNFDGINVDFEALDIEAGEGYVQFIRELSLKCENNGIILSVDNYVPTEYTSFYNRKEQSYFADYIIIMGYDEHYAGSDEEGSVASIGFVEKGILDTLKEVPADQVILGAPFFTRVWIETPKEIGEEVEAAAEDYVPYELSSRAVSMEEAWNMVSVNGAEAVWSEEDGQYYAEYVNEGLTYKIWLEEKESMELRLKAAKKKKLAGMSFWKLGLEEKSLWDTIIKYIN